MELWQQLGTTIIGAFSGAGAALLAGYCVRKGEARAKEQAALNSLLLDLQLKRSLATDNPQRVTAASQSTDFAQCRESVINSRQLIRDARLQLRPRSKAFDHLATMSAACNNYLHLARVNPDNYQFALRDLRASFDEQAKELGTLKGVAYRRPGSFAYSVRNDHPVAREN